MRHCCVPICKTKWVKCEPNKKYHSFPKEQGLREQWIRVLELRREPSKHSYVCSNHFQMSDYNVTNYGDFPGHLKKAAIPSQNLPHSNGSSNQAVANFPTVKTSRVTFTLPATPAIEFVAIKEEPIDETCEASANPIVPMIINSSKKKTSSPVIVTMKDASTTTAETEVRSCQTQTAFVNLRINYKIISDTELIYATGLGRNRFNLISHKLEKYSPISENTVCVKKDSLLVTLFILRHQSNLVMAQFIFGFSRRVMSEVCQEVVDKLHCLLRRDGIWDLSFRDTTQFRTLLENIEKYRNRKK